MGWRSCCQAVKPLGFGRHWPRQGYTHAAWVPEILCALKQGLTYTGRSWARMSRPWNPIWVGRWHGSPRTGTSWVAKPWKRSAHRVCRINWLAWYCASGAFYARASRFLWTTQRLGQSPAGAFPQPWAYPLPWLEWHRTAALTRW